MQELLTKHLDILCCPNCRGSLVTRNETLACRNCGAIYKTDNGIPLLFYPHDPMDQAHDVTDVVKVFYEENPFPNYDDFDSKESLAEKARQGIFARLLDEQIPGGAKVLECGCGTGQLSNFLGMRWNRAVFGTDLCLNSLRLAKGFRDRCDIKNAAFVQQNLFRPAFRDESFDLVICNGVLHHTSDPRGGFRSISRLVKHGRFIIIGLYNTVGRLSTDLRRFLFRATGDSYSSWTIICGTGNTIRPGSGLGFWISINTRMRASTPTAKSWNGSRRTALSSFLAFPRSSRVRSRPMRRSLLPMTRGQERVDLWRR